MYYIYLGQVPLISLDNSEFQTSASKPDSYSELPNILKRTFQNTFTSAAARRAGDQENQVRAVTGHRLTVTKTQTTT